MNDKITGLGGVFWKTPDKPRMQKWYREKLGVPLADDGYGWLFEWREKDDPETVGMTVISPFPGDTEYFDPSPAPFMLNFRVDDLDAVLERLAREGVEQVGDVVDEEYGRFAWVLDCDGTKVELWQPPAVSPEA